MKASAAVSIVFLGIANPAFAQDITAGMAPIIIARYGEQICGYKVNLERLGRHVERVSGIPALSVFRDRDLPKMLDHMWEKYEQIGRAKTCASILAEYGPRGVEGRGILTK